MKTKSKVNTEAAKLVALLAAPKVVTADEATAQGYLHPDDIPRIEIGYRHHRANLLQLFREGKVDRVAVKIGAQRTFFYRAK